METIEFTSPSKKLIHFFQNSRDVWKRKCMERKSEVKRLSNDVRATKKSRDKWKEVAKRERQRANQLEEELRALKIDVG